MALFALGSISSGLRGEGWAAVVPGLAVAAVFAGIIWFSRKRGARDILQGKTEADLAHTYEFDSNGYTIVTPTSNTRSAWSALYGYAQTKDTFFLLPNPTVRIFIPKRAFSNLDVLRLEALLDTHLKERTAKNGVRRALLLWVVLILMFVVIWQFLNADTQRGPRPPEGTEESQ